MSLWRGIVASSRALDPGSIDCTSLEAIPMLSTRRLLNPVPTAVTRWCGSRVRRGAQWLTTKGRGLRGRPWPAAEDASGAGDDDDNLSPAGWIAPPGVKPAWNWLPPDHGAFVRRDLLPTWVRIWYRLPFIDRYAYVWMWHHGCWELTADDPGFDDPAGVREPRRPRPTSPPDAVGLEPSDLSRAR